MSTPRVLFVWLVRSVEKRPILFTIVSGLTSYVLALLWLLSFIRMDVMASQVALLGASLIIVVFHWFIARYERKTKFTQLAVLFPAVGLVFIVLWGFGEFGRTREVCILDVASQELRDCRVVSD